MKTEGCLAAAPIRTKDTALSRPVDTDRFRQGMMENIALCLRRLAFGDSCGESWSLRSPCFVSTRQVQKAIFG